jgi:hypothetical protein
VRRHILLEVKVSELISGLKLKESSKFLVGVDLATIGRILELVSTNVSVNFTSDISASHFRALFLAKEGSEFIRNLSGLNETRRSAVSSLSLTLRRLLLGSLDFARPFLLKSLVFTLNRINKGS